MPGPQRRGILRPMAEPAAPSATPALEKKLAPTVILLGWVSLLTDVSSEMLYPLIPVFLTAVLGAPMAALGLIEGLAEGAANILKVFSGWWSDRLAARRPFILAGYALSALAKPALALARGWPFVLLTRLADRTGKGLRTSARDALIADSSHAGQRGRAFGLHRAMDSFGAVLGPLAAVYFMSRLGDRPQAYRTIFLWAFLPAALGVLLLFQVRERTFRPRHQRPMLSWRAVGRDFRVFLLINFIFSLGNSSDTFLILRARTLFAGSANPMVTVILSYVLYNLSYSLGSYPAGRLADRIGSRRVFTAGLLLFALVYAGFALNRDPRLVWVLFALYGFYTALTDGVGKAYATQLIQDEHRATGLGLFQMSGGVAAFAASLTAGLLWQRIGYQAAFLYGTVASLLSALLFITFRLRSGRSFVGAARRV